MKIHNLFLITLIISLTSGCALTGGNNSHYGANIRKPGENQYNSTTRIPVRPPIPEPNRVRPDIPLENLYKTFYAPYSTLYTACLRAIENLNLSLTTFNSTTGIIEFKTMQGQVLALKVTPDKEYNSRSSVKLFSQDGSRRFNTTFVNTLFESIYYQVNNKY